MPLESNWELKDVQGSLRGMRRSEDIGDLLAFRVAGEHPMQSVYVYLYGDDPAAIYYDLEDERAETDEWDNAVHRGEVKTTEALNDVVSGWLNG